ncbi:MAG: DinB family protein [Pyrinomonadaceae bacterium]|nr:DinB family protein [Phycisphaerales bacterium]
MGQVADIILSSAKRTRGIAEGLLQNVRADQFARLATSDGRPVQSNHPAFVYGHLSTYPVRIVTMLGGTPIPNPPKFDDLFAAGKPCLDDPTATIYPPMEAVMGHFYAGVDTAIAAIEKAADADFARINPTEGRSRELFPTVGAATNFLMGPHQMLHFGQVSAWRRFMGLGSPS